MGLASPRQQPRQPLHPGRLQRQHQGCSCRSETTPRVDSPALAVSSAYRIMHMSLDPSFQDRANRLIDLLPSLEL